MFQILEIYDWPWNWVRIISESTGNLIFVLYLELYYNKRLSDGML